MDDLIKAHKLNKILSKIKDSIDKRHKKDILDKFRRNKKIVDTAEKIKYIIKWINKK